MTSFLIIRKNFTYLLKANYIICLVNILYLRNYVNLEDEVYYNEPEAHDEMDNTLPVY